MEKSNTLTRTRARKGAENSSPGNSHLAERSNQLNNPSHVTPALISHLAGRFSPEFIAGKIDELLNATHVTKGGQVIADNRAREAGLRLLMAYLIGPPVQRQEIVQVNFDSLEELQRRAQQSPALRAAVAKILEPLPGNIMPDSVKQGDVAPPVEVSEES
jgi:hypothetical protein